MPDNTDTMVAARWPGRFITGVLGGVLGGLLMAVFAMTTSLLRGPGMWMPVKLIGGFVLGPRAVNNLGTFDLTPIASGIIVHIVVSAVLGGLFAVLSSSLPDETLILYGVVFALIIWFLALSVVLPLVDPLLVNNTNPALFALSHILYGLVLGWWTGSHV